VTHTTRVNASHRASPGQPRRKSRHAEHETAYYVQTSLNRWPDPKPEASTKPGATHDRKRGGALRRRPAALGCCPGRIRQPGARLTSSQARARLLRRKISRLPAGIGLALGRGVGRGP
jgi:hypothetical protein